MTTSESAAAPAESTRSINPALIVLAWLWVAIPFAYASWQLLAKVTQLFGA